MKPGLSAETHHFLLILGFCSVTHTNKRQHFCGVNFISRHVFTAAAPDFCQIDGPSDAVTSGCQCVCDEASAG